MLPEFRGEIGVALPHVSLQAVRLHLISCLATGRAHCKSTNHVQHAIDDDHAGLIARRRHPCHSRPLLRVHIIAVDAVEYDAITRPCILVPASRDVQTATVGHHAVVSARYHHVRLLCPSVGDGVVAVQHR